MKRILKVTGFAVCLIAGCYWATHSKNELSPNVLENVEALANNEYIGNLDCYGSGTVACNGHWVKMRIEGLNLE